MKRIIEFDDRRPVADTQTTVDDLHRQFTIGGRAAIFDAVGIFEFLDQSLRPKDEAGHAVTEEHEVFSARFGAEVGIEGEQTVDAIDRRAKMIGDDLGGLNGDVTEMFVDLLECRQDQLLRFLVIPRIEMG